MNYSEPCFELKDTTFRRTNINWGYGQFSQIMYYTNYSRYIEEDDPHNIYNKAYQEDFYDTIYRVISGNISYRKHFCETNRIKWDESLWQDIAAHMAVYMSKMYWLPAGRGLWACGSNLVYTRGSMANYNCAFVTIKDTEDLCWLMDCLMYGTGVGFRIDSTKWNFCYPFKDRTRKYEIEDTREGWVESVRQLLNSYFKGSALPIFDYSSIRPKGSKLKTFGGIASGPEPLITCHKRIIEQCNKYYNEEISILQLKCDLANIIGVCVIAGNMRRGAEIGLCSAEEIEFYKLKDYNKYPERAVWGWMSNNSVLLEKKSDFENLGIIAVANKQKRDIGYLNMLNIKKYGRFGETKYKKDKAKGINPCGEIPLEDYEVCNVAETFPTRCPDIKYWYEACEMTTIYCSNITLVPTHSTNTNKVVARNRRIGIGIVDFTGWKHTEETHNVIKYLRTGYKRIRKTNKKIANDIGIPESIRVTTVKPGGTVPKVAGRTSGCSSPTFKYAIVRFNVNRDSPIWKVLMDAEIPYEVSAYTPEVSDVFEFPIEFGPAPPATETSVWEQAMNVCLLQREWSDNAVSNTLYYNPDTEFEQLETVLSSIAPVTKSISLLPHTPIGAFKQMPQEGITQEEYERRLKLIKPINWFNYRSDIDARIYCDSDSCEIKV